MNKDKDIHKELEELSPFLSKMKGKKQEVEMPENYFHYLENSVMQQVALEKSPTLQVRKINSISIWTRLFSLRNSMVVSSVALLIVAVLYFNQTGIESTNTNLLFAELSDAEILNYLNENAEGLDIYFFDEIDEDVSILEMIDLEEDNIDYILEEISLETITEEVF